jgi:hypothetical protein
VENFETPLAPKTSTPTLTLKRRQSLQTAMTGTVIRNLSPNASDKIHDSSMLREELCRIPRWQSTGDAMPGLECGNCVLIWPQKRLMRFRLHN